MNKTLLTIIGCSSIFIATTLGSLIVFILKKNLTKKLCSLINGFSAGIMFAASIWGLILPSMQYAEHLGKLNCLPAIIGVFLGVAFIFIIDITVQKINNKQAPARHKLIRFVSAFTLHNIPEGMAVGFSFGNALTLGSTSAFTSALCLAFGISLQNIPEGMAVSFPIYQETGKKKTAFLIGTLSGIVEPIFALIGIFLVSQIKEILPWLLAFSAGSMIYVSVNDLIPEATENHTSIGTWSFILGFIIMMTLDIVLG